MARKSIIDLRNMKTAGEKVVYVTGYDYLTAKYEERAGVDMILVGDSLGMVTLGYDSTYPVTMADMIAHCRAVRRGAPNTFVVGDMPFMSYQVSNAQAVENAGRFVKEADCDAIKMEGGTESVCERIRAISDVGILVMGHIGLTPQFAAQMGGYRAQGKSAEAAMSLVDQAIRIEQAGASFLLVEGVPAVVGKAIVDKLNIPVYGIGAGSYTDGQLIIYADMVGYYDDFTPKFVEKYANVGAELLKGFTKYAEEVRNGNFPNNDKHAYVIAKEEADALEAQLAEK